jgi:hypothetical protein
MSSARNAFPPTPPQQAFPPTPPQQASRIPLQPQLDIQFETAFYGQVLADERAKLRRVTAAAMQRGALDGKARGLGDMSLRQLAFGLVDAWSDIVGDLRRGVPLRDVFLSTDRVLYVGLTLLLVALGVYLVDVFS